MNNKLEITTSELNAGIQEFSKLYTQGVKSWVAAGKILVSLVDADPNVYQWIIEGHPHINSQILAKFEQMGRGMLNPHLLLGGGGSLRLAKMPMSVQERYIDEPVPMVVHTPSGTDILLIKVKDMTADQSRQAFADGHVRTEGEQKAWLIDSASKAARPVGPNINAWTIRAGRVLFTQGASLTAGELATIITQLTK